MNTKCVLRLTELDGDAPSEFLIFRRGVNETSKGPLVFDDEAARAVMAAYARAGVDLMIDLAHQSLDDGARARPDAGDARGWFKLEMRGGDLYAVDVRWTPDGLRRLSERTQRYISPCVIVDTETDRAVEIVNVALCAMPATFDARPLIAASKLVALGRTKDMTPEQIKKALEIIAGEDQAGALELLKAIVVSAAGGEETPADMPAEPLAETPDPEPKPEDQAYAKELMRLTATASPSEALAEAKRRLERDAGSEEQRKALELSARVDLVAELVKLGIEFPATAWAGDAVKRVPVKRLADEPIDDLRARVALHRKNGARPAPAAPPARMPAVADGSKEISTAHGLVTLSASEIKNCEQFGAKLETYAENKAIREAARSGARQI